MNFMQPSTLCSYRRVTIRCCYTYKHNNLRRVAFSSDISGSSSTMWFWFGASELFISTRKLRSTSKINSSGKELAHPNESRIWQLSDDCENSRESEVSSPPHSVRWYLLPGRWAPSRQLNVSRKVSHDQSHFSTAQHQRYRIKTTSGATLKSEDFFTSQISAWPQLAARANAVRWPPSATSMIAPRAISICEPSTF